jgi:hypothetical protein
VKKYYLYLEERVYELEFVIRFEKDLEFVSIVRDEVDFQDNYNENSLE